MKGLVLSEVGHFVNALPSVDITGGATLDRFKMSNHGHATIAISVGASAAAFTKIIVRECDAASGGTATDIAFRMAKEESANGDTLTALEAVAATGYTPSANDGILYVIELDASELSDGYKWVEVALTNGTNSVLASAIVILSGSRYAGSANATAIA